eukprot:scaffold19040_cov97-Skeletonema_menzelii.AAC.1
MNHHSHPSSWSKQKRRHPSAEKKQVVVQEWKENRARERESGKLSSSPSQEARDRSVSELATDRLPCSKTGKGLQVY